MTPVEIRIRKSPPHITFLIDILQKHGRILSTTPVFLQKQGVLPGENIFQLKRQTKYQGIRQTSGLSQVGGPVPPQFLSDQLTIRATTNFQTLRRP